MLDERKIEKASLDLWLLERGESNQQDLDRLKRAIPVVMKECLLRAENNCKIC